MALKLNLDSLDELDGLIPHIQGMDKMPGPSPANGIPSPATHSSLKPMAPEIPNPTSPQPMTSIPGAGAPDLQKPTTAESHAAGKAEFERGLPAITAQPFTPENYQQKQEKLDYEAKHPWGSDISEHPGFGGKLAHVASKVGNIAGDIFAPATMANIPGTDLNKQRQTAQNTRGFTTATGNEEKQALTNEAEAATGLKEQQGELAGAKTEAIENPEVKTKQDKNVAALAKLGYELGPDGTVQPIPDERLSGDARVNRQLHESSIRLKDAQQELALAGNDPNSPKFKLAQAKVDVERQNIQHAAEALGLHRQEFANKQQEQELVKPSGQAQSRASAAQAAITVMPGLLEQVKRNGASMGPLMGRLSRGEVAIGNVPPEVAQLYSAMKSMYALQPAVHGFRNANFVKDFETAVGTLERNPEAFVAGMQGLLPTLHAVANEGVTYRHRIVEGGGNTPNVPAPAAGGSIPSFAEWQAAQKKP